MNPNQTDRFIKIGKDFYSKADIVDHVKSLGDILLIDGVRYSADAIAATISPVDPDLFQIVEAGDHYTDPNDPDITYKIIYFQMGDSSYVMPVMTGNAATRWCDPHPYGATVKDVFGEKFKRKVR